MKTYAIIENGSVTNVIIWDGETEWSHDGKAVLIPEGSHAGIGWDYVKGKFVDNRPNEYEA